MRRLIALEKEGGGIKDDVDVSQVADLSLVEEALAEKWKLQWRLVDLDFKTTNPLCNVEGMARVGARTNRRILGAKDD